MIKFLDLHAQYTSIKKDIDEAISSVIANSAFIGGEGVRSFECEFSEYVCTKYSVGVGNGTDALEIAIEAADLPDGAEIIVPANSFIASSEAVTRSGYKVVFADVDPKTYILTADNILPHVNSNTAAIIAVHLYGHPCDMDGIMELAELNKIVVIEDCAQAHGAEYKGNRVGSIGHIATFSFYPGKNLGAYGDGGMITTNDKNLAVRCRMIANHGRIAKYDHEFEGRNSRLDGMQAAILSTKLKFIEQWTKRRIEIADKYIKELADVDEVILPVRMDWARQVYHLFVIRSKRRNELKTYLDSKNIQTGIHYPVLLPNLSAYKYLNTDVSSLSCENFGDEVLSLPIGEHLSSDDIDTVVSEIKIFFSGK